MSVSFLNLFIIRYDKMKASIQVRLKLWDSLQMILIHLLSSRWLAITTRIKINKIDTTEVRSFTKTKITIQATTTAILIIITTKVNIFTTKRSKSMGRTTMDIM